MKDLERQFYEGIHRLSNKWRHYLPVYHDLFSGYCGENVNILEVGVFQGGSLQIWKAFFGEQANVFGIDSAQDSHRFEEEQIRIFAGDQLDRNFLEATATRIIEQTGKIDIIIDDGGHTMDMQKTTFEALYPHLIPGGIYVCEDTHTSYWPEFGGGLRNPDSFIEYAKGLVDRMNALTAFGSNDATGVYTAWRDHEVTPDFEPENEFALSTESIQFVDSLVVFRKARERKNPAGYRSFVYAGQPESLDPDGE